MNDEPIHGDALISDDERYRYLLTREWSEGSGFLGFVMLNPSTADAREDDPTIRRCIGFAKTWSYRGIMVANLFAFRATKPEELVKADDPVGVANDKFLQTVLDRCNLTIAAWGAHPFAAERGREVRKRFNGRLHCLGMTKAGFPKHPLYLLKTTLPIPYRDGDKA